MILYQEPLRYEQTIDSNTTNIESKSSNKKCQQFCLIFGLIFIYVQIGLNFLVIIGRGLGLTFADCDSSDSRCKDKYEEESTNYNKACDFTLPYLFITSIITCLSVYRRKKLKVISINFILIILKIILFIYYIKYLNKSLKDDDSHGIYIGLFIGLEISGNFLVIISEILK